MLQIITKIICSFCLSTTAFCIIKKISKVNKKYFTKQNILIQIIILIPSFILYQKEYNLMIYILSYLLMIILYKKYFKLTIESSVLICSYMMILISIFDVIVSTFLSFFITYEEMRTTWYIMIIDNIIIGTAAYQVSRIKIISSKLKYLCNIVKFKKDLNFLFFLNSIILIIAILFFNINSIFSLNIYFIITLCCFLVMLFLYYLYIHDYYNYKILNDKYNSLFDCIQAFEDWIDDEQLQRHELKNTLSIIKSMTKNKKIINKINEIIKLNINIDEKNIEVLKSIPKGGFKGLLYYKIALADKKGEKIIIDVGDRVKSKLDKMNDDKIKQLCIILGIYIDNAIEAVEKIENKNITIEIYNLNGNINIVISNACNKVFSIKEMNKKGISTKGKNRGKGLYYVNKIIKKTDWFKIDQKFLNGYFIQHIIVK